MSNRNHSYQYFKDSTGSIIAVSTYAGHTVRGKAKCHPNDTFNEELGRKIAAARCDVKIAEKRLRASDDNLYKAMLEYKNAQRKVMKMIDYFANSRQNYFDAHDNLDSILEEVETN